MKHRKSKVRQLKKKRSGRNDLSTSLRLPQDVVKGETLLTFIGKSAVQIENYRSILLYSDTSIRIQAKRYQLCVAGKNLCIRYYDKDEMKITGRIESITFE